MPRINSGHPIPALRPEQSDHVPWADCPQGLSSTSVRCAHPPGKRLLLPILTAGLAMSRAMKLDSYHLRLERARARLFPPSKWAGLFPSAAYRRSAPPQLALSRLKRRCLGCFDAAGLASQHRKTKLFSFSAGDVPTKTMLIGMLRYSLDISATQKASVNIESRLPLLRAGGPVARRRSFLFNWRGATPDPRAVAPVVPRR